jgi:sugar phosphate permease
VDAPGEALEPKALEDDRAPTSAENRAERAAARRALFRDPTLYCYGASYFCIKLIRYSLLFWLPFYLHTALHYDEGTSAYLSTSFEVGGIVGTIAFGAVSDRLKNVSRSAASAVGLLGLAVALFVYQRVSGLGMAVNFASMALVGALLFGPDALLSGAASQDLGGTAAASTATGVVNGFGSIGAVLQSFVTVKVSERFGWSALFYVFLGLAFLGAAALVPTLFGRGKRVAEAEG